MEFSNTLADMNIGERIRLERKKLKLSQDELARRAKITQGLISQIESGAVGASKYLNAIARALDVSADWLETGKGEPIRRQASAPMSLHYPPVLEDTLAVIHDPDGGKLVLVVFRDVNGTQVTLKLDDAAARKLSELLITQGK